MENEELILIEKFCIHHNVEFAFIRTLTQFGLLEVTTIEEADYLHKAQIKELEKMIRLHYDLDINVEGIQAISHLLQRIDNLQDEIITLKNRLAIYEGNIDEIS